MTSMTIIYILTAAVALCIIAVLLLVRAWHQLEKRVGKLKEELVEVSGDVAVGRRLDEKGGGSVSDLAKTINGLFDAIVERDEEIQGRDQLFADFSRTLPEIVLVS